jgi:hypothetical protein
MQQLGLDQIAPAVEINQSREGDVFFAKLRHFAQALVMRFDPLTGEEIKDNTDAAFKAGLGKTKRSAASMASQYKSHPIVLAEIEKTKRELAGASAKTHAEVIGGWRMLLEMTTGQRSVRMPVTDLEGNPVLDKETNQPVFMNKYFWKPDVAEKVLEKMGKATGLLDNKTDTSTQRPALIISANPDISPEDWAKQYGSS